MDGESSSATPDKVKCFIYLGRNFMNFFNKTCSQAAKYTYVFPCVILHFASSAKGSEFSVQYLSSVVAQWSNSYHCTYYIVTYTSWI